MTWTRLSDDFADKPSLLECSRSARLLHVEALVYCNRQGNDGHFRTTLVPRMTDAEDWSQLVAELLAAGIWKVPDGEPGRLHVDWALWDQEPAEAVQKRKKDNAEANVAYRRRGGLHKAGDHSQCTDRCPQRAAWLNRDTSRDGSRDVLPSRPSPSPPVPTPREGQGEGAVQTGSAGATPTDGSIKDTSGHGGWAKYPTNPNAHPFIAGAEGKCLYQFRCSEDGPGYVCDDHPDEFMHGHPFIRDAESGLNCSTCDFDKHHPAHAQTTQGDGRRMSATRRGAAG